MIAIEYVEQIRKAFRDKDMAEVARLEREYGDQEVTFKELEEVVSYDTEMLLSYIMETDSNHASFAMNLLSVLHAKNVLTEKELDAILETEDNEDKGEEEEDE